MAAGNRYAVVEIMGHRTRAGVISDAQIAGATLLRIEHPTRADHTGAEPLTEYYSPAAIFAIHLCSQDEAEAVAKWAWSAPLNRLALSPAPDDYYEWSPDTIDSPDISAWEAVQTCRVCGCTDTDACPGGCAWAAPGLCTACVDKASPDPSDEPPVNDVTASGAGTI